MSAGDDDLEGGAARASLRSLLRPAVAFEVWSTLILALAFVPAAAWLLDRLVARSGRYAVTDHDLVSFALSVPGLLFVVLGLGFLLLSWHVEQAGLLLMVSGASRGERASVSRVLWETLKKSPALLRLGVLHGLALLVLAVPLLLGLALVYVLLLSDYDFYYYFTMRPTAWWVAAGIGGALLAAYVLLAAWLYLRWAYAIPILVLERERPWVALRESWRRTRARARGLALPLVARWAVVLIVTGGLTWAVGRLAAGWLKDASRLDLLVPAVLATVALLAVVDLLGLVVGKTAHALLVGRAYLGDPHTPALGEARVIDSPLPGGVIRLAWIAAAAVVVALAVGSAATLLAGLGERRETETTGHRGSKRRAPENTLSALEDAIEQGADYAEIDVQTTADGAVVLLHDADFRRVSGDGRRLRDLAYADLADLDVGSWFDPRFAAERVPTLQQVIDAVRGRIKLNIELKYTWDDPTLAQRVVEVVRANGFEDQCVLSSLHRPAVKEVEALAPELETGLIVLTGVGGLSRVEADFLSVGAGRVSSRLVRDARRRGLGVHVWTVNEVRDAVSMVEMGVDNIITDEPQRMRGVIDEWNGLDKPERLALWLRNLIVDDPDPIEESP